MTDGEISDDEIQRRLERLIILEPYVDIILQEAVYKKSRNILVKRWHTLIVASLVLAVGITTFIFGWIDRISGVAK